jgi:anti-sigma regulatory factor (Ser/Thr protein kinase)
VGSLLFAPNIAALFGMPLVETEHAIRVFAFSLPLWFANILLITLYQAQNRVVLANILTISRALWVLAVAWALSVKIGLAGVWHGFWIAEGLTLLIAIALSFYKRGEHTPVLLLDTRAEKSGQYKSFSVPSTAASITVASAGITDFCEQNGLSPKQTMAISLAIEELLVMILEHSKPRDMNVRILLADNMIVLRIRGDGEQFDPLAYTQNAGADQELEVMGIRMIIKMAVGVDYRNTFGVNNTTVLLDGET